MMDSSRRVSTVRPLLPSSEVRNARVPRQETAVDDDNLAVFSGMPNSSADVDAIERQVDAELILLDPFASADDVARATNTLRVRNGVITSSDDNDDIVEAFVSHQPHDRQSIIIKKLQLYEMQLHERDKQLAALRVIHATALTSIDKLKDTVVTQQQEFDTAQDEWENEKEKLLRFRGPGTDVGTGVLFQMKMGVSAAAMAARTRTLNEADLQKQRELRQQMLRGAADVQDQLLDDNGAWDMVASSQVSSTRRLWRKFRRWMSHHLSLFANDIRQIEAQFGYSVASYFRFFRWIILSFVAISIPSIVLLVLHVLTLLDTGHTFGANWAAFVGVFPASLLFPMYLPIEAMRYTLVLILIQVILLLVTIRKWVAEDRQSKMVDAVDGGSKQPRFSRVVLNAWDFSMTTFKQASDLKKAMAEHIKVTLQDDALAEKLRQRTRRERYHLYARRAAAFLLYVVIQAASWYLIIIVTTQSSQIQAAIVQRASFFAPYVGNMVPAVATLINGILPTMISQLTSLEKWDDVGFAIKAMVTRLYLAKVLNVLIQLVSYALLLDPYLLTGTQSVFEIWTFDGPTVRKNVMLAFKPELYACRAEQVASGLLTLVVTDFTVSKVVAISSLVVGWSLQKIQFEWTRFRTRRRIADAARVIPISDPASSADSAIANGGVETTATTTEAATQKSSSRSASAVSALAEASAPHVLLKKAEFQVPQKMVALLYSCTIALVAIPLAPTAAVLALLLHVLNFKLDMLFLMHFQKKPTTPWSAKDAGSFFIKFYFCTVVICMAFTQFFLANNHLPKQCDLQDTLLSEPETSSTNAALCMPGSYNAMTELCNIDPTVSNSLYFLPTTTSMTNECVVGYPKCVCTLSLACGPFTSDRNGYAPLLTYVLSVRGLASVYSGVTSSVAVAWGVVLATVTGTLFLRNSLRVQTMMAHARDHEAAITFTTLRKKIKQLENRVRVHKISHDT